MIRKLIILIAAVLIVGCFLCIFDRKGNAFSQNPTPTITNVPPILDGSIDPSLHLKSCYSIDQIPAYCTSICEWWSGSQGDVSIYRWHFDDSKKMDDFFKPSSRLLTHEILSWQRPFKWSIDPDISDKTCWGRPYVVLFIKGKDIIRVHLNSRINDEQKKAYVKKIAQSIAKKL
ncbi:MAG: hypothetical protein AB2L14_24130 [Candidatus Xenobiia bacterium LiM19]